MTPTVCLHGELDTEVFQRWKKVERQIMSVPEDDRDAQVLALSWCGCCGGPSKGEFCTRCQDITPEQYQRLMGAEYESAWSAQRVAALLDKRYRSEALTIITTNLTHQEIAVRYGKRLADRLNEWAWAALTGPSLRRELAVQA